MTGLRKVVYDTSNYDYFIASQKDDAKFPKLTMESSGLSDRQWSVLTSAASASGAMTDADGTSVDVGACCSNHPFAHTHIHTQDSRSTLLK